MWGVIMVSFLMVVAQVKSHGIAVDCHESNVLPPYSDKSPSFLVALRLEAVTVGGDDMLNISWAINVDISIECLTGTRIRIEGKETYDCKYTPPLAKANLTRLKQVWFHHLERVSPGSIFVEAANLPLPPMGSGLSYLWKEITIPTKPHSTTPEPAVKDEIHTSTEIPNSGGRMTIITENGSFATCMRAIFGVLVSLMILTPCFIIYKSCGQSFASFLGFKQLSTAPPVPVSVLLVYPAENAAFQKAVLALAEFLQWHGGCSVAVDMWQQGKIAELGPMRWLAEQVQAADRVIIICPQPSHTHSKHGVSGPSIPAATHDLYPLILNMVASHARSPSEMAKFWVVQLGEQQERRLDGLAVELRACGSFCLMKDLKKLFWRLHTQRQDKKKITSYLQEMPYNEKNTAHLREAIEQLVGSIVIV